MRSYMLYAIVAGVAWGVGGYFEKMGLQQMRIPSILGITIRTLVALVILGLISLPAWKGVGAQSDARSWIMIVVGGGLVAGALGMWSFYSALAKSENLGITLAMAFAFAPLAGTVLGLVRGDQRVDIKIGLGLLAMGVGLVLLQVSQKRHG
ncbi:MAG: EamA family transporter [bacterium]